MECNTQIKNFPGYYITRNGKVWSKKSNKWLKPGKVAGYPSVVLMRNGERNDRLIHGLILETFVGSRPKDMECRHLDGNPNNNNLENLKWGTCSANRHDEFNYKGTCRRICKLVPQQVRVIYHLLVSGELTAKEIGTIFNVTDATIRHIKRGKTWSDVTGLIQK